MKSGPITMFLVKFLPEEEWVKELISGKIYMNRLSCFKRLEEQQVSNRADRHEGVSGWFQPGGTHATINGMDISSDLAGPIEIQRDWLNDLNIFCLYAAHTGDLDLKTVSIGNIEILRRQLEIPVEYCQRLGTHAVIVKDCPKFLDRIKSAAKSRGYAVAPIRRVMGRGTPGKAAQGKYGALFFANRGENSGSLVNSFNMAQNPLSSSPCGICWCDDERRREASPR